MRHAVFGFVAIGFVVVVVGLVVVGIGRSARDRNRLEQAVEDPTWSELTDGALSAEHQGPVLAFWATGGLGEARSRGGAADVFVALDERVIVVVHPLPWPRRPSVEWIERTDHGPVLCVRKGLYGPVVSDEASGLKVQRRSWTPEKITLDLRRRGWLVDGEPALDDLPAPPA